MLGSQRALLQERLPEDVGLGAALRDAGLRAVGAGHLVSDKRDESGHRKKRLPPSEQPDEVAVTVHLSDQQKAAIDSWAKQHGVSRTVLLQDALRAELGLEQLEPSSELGGWPRGRRQSRTPPR